MVEILVRLGEPFRLEAADRVRPADGPVTFWLTGVRLVTNRPESDEWVYLEDVRIMPDSSLGDHVLVLARAARLQPERAESGSRGPAGRGQSQQRQNGLPAGSA